MSGYFDDNLKRERRSRIGSMLLAPILFLVEFVGMVMLSPVIAGYFIVRYYQGYTVPRDRGDLSIGEAAVLYSALGVISLILDVVLLWNLLT